MRVKALETQADSSNPRSLANRLRRRRVEDLLAEIASAVPRGSVPVRILDVGGTVNFWQQAGLVGDSRFAIVTLNKTPDPDGAHVNVQAAMGDATHMPEFADRTFDVVFSNSVVEHVGSMHEQQAMASEMERIARYLVVCQTPCRTFPMEPHFQFPFFALLPFAIRVWLVQHLALGWEHQRLPDPEEARTWVQRIQLLRGQRFLDLFDPRARLQRERLFGLTKSFTVVFVLDDEGH